ncbi:hypothetical protein GOP47_0009910 [Adiantum capillus-veneris]|uniref:Uncharacterized protein n=1 Tax=Adiantum capillus-veneris TaxID=13818 RepID=A0A9D4ZHN8_ADICA|nr:hypothetical protein GOP47_0009910 [Adiantum capillus-veneris]
MWKIPTPSQNGLQSQIQEGMNHEDIFYAVKCVYEVDMQFINFLDYEDGCMSVDARLLDMLFDARGMNVGYKVKKILLIPFDPGGITLNLGLLLQAFHSQSSVGKGYVDFFKAALLAIYRMQNEGIFPDAIPIWVALSEIYISVLMSLKSKNKGKLAVLQQPRKVKRFTMKFLERDYR